MLGKRLELLKARQKSGNALILAKNGSIFRSCATTKIAKAKNCVDSLMELSDVELIREYRMPKAAILEVCANLQNDLESKLQSERILTVQE